ncbi:MAG: TolC family protein [Nevskia sp.]|nr:TolC family protein [Nevskia sp.]
MRFVRQRRDHRVAPAMALIASWLMVSCAGYTPKRLDGEAVAATLASPDRSVLVKQASAMSHPALPKVQLDFAQPLSLDEISVIAVLANPDLRALRAQQRVADAQIFSAGLLADPQLSLGVDRLMAPSGQGLANAYAGSLTLDLLGALMTRNVEIEGARSAATQVRLDIAWQEWNTAGQARLLALRLPYQLKAQRLARRAADDANAQLDRTLVAAANRDLNGDEVESRRIAAADAETRALAAERDAQTTQLELNRVLGLQPNEPLTLTAVAPLDHWQHPDESALFENARQQRLDLQALAAGYESQQAAVHRAVLGQYPRVSIVLNRARDTSRVHTFGPAITLDIPLWNRNRGAIASTEADRDRLQQEYAARLHQTRADIAALVEAQDRDERARAALAEQLESIAPIAEALQHAADRGDVTQPIAESAKAALVDKQLALLALEQACAEQRLALALSVGHSLTDADSKS